MDKIFDLLTQIPENIKPYTIFILLVGFSLYVLVTKLPNILDSLGYFKINKIKRIEEALKSEYMDDTYKQVLKNEYSLLQISSSLNINPDKDKLRESIRIYEIIKERCSIKDVFFSLYYISEYDKDKSSQDLELILKEISGSHEGLKRFLLIFGYFVSVLSLGYLMYFDYKIIPTEISDKFKVVNFIQYTLFVLSFIALAISIIQRTKRRISAMKVLESLIVIKKEQEASQDTSSS